MIDTIALLFVCQLVGEVIHRLLGLPLPGSVVGMAVLIGWFYLVHKEHRILFPQWIQRNWRWFAFVQRERKSLESVTKWLTSHLSIMFLPAAAGLIKEGHILAHYGLALVIAVVISALLTMSVTVLVFQWALKRVEKKTEPPQGSS